MVLPYLAAAATVASSISNIFGGNEAARAQENATEHGIHALQQYLTPYADFGLNSMYQLQSLTGSPGLTPYTSQTNILGLLQPGTWQNLGRYDTAAPYLATQPATWQGTSTPGTGAPSGHIASILSNLGVVDMPTAGGSLGGPIYGSTPGTAPMPGIDFGTVNNAFGGLLEAGLSPQAAGMILGGATGGYNPIAPGYTGGPNLSTLENLPGFQFLLTEGLKGVHNSAAARGLGTSGAELMGAAKYATGLASTKYNDFWSQIMDQTKFGANVAGQLGTGIANLNVSRGNAQAAGSANTWSNIASLPQSFASNFLLGSQLGLGGGVTPSVLPTMAYAPNPYSNAYA